MEVREIPAKYTHFLRFKVLWPHRNPDDCSLPVDDLETTHHFATFHEHQVISIATLIEEQNPKFPFERQYRLRAMATDPDFGGRGAGASLVQHVLEFLKLAGVQLLWCDARLIAVDFYLKQGFEVINDIYQIPIIGPHKLMFYQFENATVNTPQS